ncbi:hypothetical protein DL96DRAFT_1488848 [Flagelloscypha sp. PMI_526]|nr:hypothetical protein DL96DRAFT_1488848 [Flagelloscypha sp. PMI_526]
MTGDSRLVYQVHCVPIDESTERQAIRIFGIYTHTQLDRLPIDSLAFQLGKMGKEYRRRCNWRNPPLTPGDYVVAPASWPSSQETTQETDHMPRLPKQDLDQIHTLLVTEKFIPFSKDLLKGILANLDATHVFAVSQQEREIIEHERSCYVIGRSGTGKTTTMLFKMFGLEKTYEEHRDQFDLFGGKPRQVFVTKSHVLASKVEEAYGNLRRSLLVVGKTKEQLLAMGALPKQNRLHQDLVAKDNKTYRADLPERFSMLKDHHFPLFITFERLCLMLENDILHNINKQNAATTPTSAITSSSRSSAAFSGVFIDFHVFKRGYWPHFSQTLTKGFSDILVYNEIMGVLQGSELACRNQKRYLDRSTYENLSQRTQWTFASQRSAVYSIFEQYQRKKHREGDYDAADRTYYLLEMLEDGSLQGQNIDYLFVDEAQDNLLIDALLLRSLCRNPNGLFWAGDTAQTISVGSAFRFSDLKAFMWRLEDHKKETDFIHLQREPPQTFQLTTNYRSHAGIVSCAFSVISIISQFWSNSLDVLAPEKGLIDGEKPVFFTGWDEKKALYEQFLSDSSSGSYVEFGAKQCILVRNEAALKRLQEETGAPIGIIMTLYDSKGLEFDDVLIYNFFEDSPMALAQWRVVLNVLASQNRDITPPRFNETLHAGICNELKFLYVAITRARKNAWIVDRSDKGEPMRMVWTAFNQIQNCTPDTDVARLQVSSTSEEWGQAQQAWTMFKKELWLQAMYCFERAGNVREATICKAYHLVKKAEDSPIPNVAQEKGKHQQAYQLAADAFFQCALLEGNSVTERREYYRNAAQMLKSIGDHKGAADTFILATDYGDAADVYRSAGMFDDLVQIVLRYRDSMELPLVENLLDLSRLFYFQLGDQDSLIKARRLFSDIESALTFLSSRGLDYRRAVLLESAGYLIEAAELYASQGSVLKAVELYFSEAHNPDMVRRGQEALLQGLRQYFDFELSFEKPKHSKHVRQWMELCSTKGMDQLTPAEQDEFRVFEAIYMQKLDELKRLALRFRDLYEDIILACFCLDVYFRGFPDITNLTLAELSGALGWFDLYSQILNNVATQDPSVSHTLRRLFRITVLHGTFFLFPNGSKLQEAVVELSLPSKPDLDSGGSLVTHGTMKKAFRYVLRHRLQLQTLTEEEQCLRAPNFGLPCFELATAGLCSQFSCGYRHVSAKEMTPETYTALVGLHFQQILILSRIVWIDNPAQDVRRLDIHYNWLQRLYNILFPALHSLGSLASLRSSLIKEGREALQIVKYWSQNVLQARFVNGDSDPRFLSQVMRISFLSFFFDKVEAPKYIFGSPAFHQFARMPNFVTNAWRGNSITEAMARALYAWPGDKNCVTQGILFVEKVASLKLNVDIDVLCNFLDYLASILILSRPNTDGIILPESWIVILLKHLGRRPDKDVLGWKILVETISVVLEALRSKSANHLYFHGTVLGSHSCELARSVYISRLCRTMGILAYNFDQPGAAQDAIWYIISEDFASFGEPNGLPSLYKCYAIPSGSWEEICSAVMQSNGDATMDRMCELIHESIPEEHLDLPWPRVTRIWYTHLDQSLADQLLGHTSSFTGIASRSRDSSLPANTSTSTSSLEAPPETKTQRYATDLAEVIASQTSVESIAKQSFQPTAEQQRASLIIRDYILQRKKAREFRASATLYHTQIDKHHQDCLKVMKDSTVGGASSRRQRLLLLGVVPHVLYVLQIVEDHIESKIKEIQRGFESAQHGDLEMISAAMDKLCTLSERLQETQKLFDPISLSNSSLQELEFEKGVLLVEQLVGTLPVDVKAELALDLGVCVCAIDTGRRRKTVSSEPIIVLNTAVHPLEE